MEQIRHHRYAVTTIGALLAAASALLWQLVVATPASMVSDTYFDSADVETNATIRLNVGQTQYVRQAGAELKAYFNSSAGGVIEIINYHFCPGHNGDAILEPAASDVNSGDNISEYSIYVGSVRVHRVIGEYYRSSSSRCNDRATLRVTGLPLDPAGSGRYVANISVNHIASVPGPYDGIQNTFYVDGDENGAIVTHAAPGASRPTGAEVTIEQVDSRPENTDYNIKFGADCSVTDPGGEIRRLRFYDIDNEGGSGAQQNGRISMRLLETNPDGSNRVWRDINGDDPWYPPSLSNDTSTATFRAFPGKRYELRVRNVYHNNVFQFVPPFDGIFYLRPCVPTPAPEAMVAPLASISPSVAEPGATANAQMGLRNTDSGSGSVSYSRSFWFEKNNIEAGGAVYNAGDDILIGGVQTGNMNINGNTTIPLATWRSATTRVDSNITHICTSVRITARNATTNIRSPNPVVACASIGKYPHMEVRNGDLWAGGVLPSSSATCTLATEPIIRSSQRRIPAGGPYYTSFATYGVTSLGLSRLFGSAGLTYGAGAGIFDDLVFANSGSGEEGYFFNTAAQGDNFPASVHSRCLNDPFSRFASRATSDNSGTVIDVNSLTTDTRLTANTTITLTAATLPPGKRIVVYAPNADIRIAGDIRYADTPYGSTNDIPQLIVLTERNILVADSVAQIDGIFGAKFNFYTCDLIPRLNVCATPLTVNGAIVTGQHLVPLRTAGAELPDYGAMAETFNLHPDVLLNQLPAEGSADVHIRTVNEREVPPRF